MNCAILTEESVLPRQEGNAMAAAAGGGGLTEWASGQRCVVPAA